jgi:hypothetical protein
MGLEPTTYALARRRSTTELNPHPGGAEGNRTPDLMNAIHALSQLSYSPESRRFHSQRLVEGGGFEPPKASAT